VVLFGLEEDAVARADDLYRSREFLVLCMVVLLGGDARRPPALRSAPL
jgi:hypothetical protein